MKNDSSLQSNNTNTPKTPGGISKSLLTPCRRLGLSRNWRKSGPSPFISPLTTSSTIVVEEKKETRKRKARVQEESTEGNESVADDNEINTENIDKTPSRNIVLPRRKRSKTFISTINKSQDEVTVTHSDDTKEKSSKEKLVEESERIDTNNENTEVTLTPIQTNSKKSKKRSSPLKTTPKSSKSDPKPKVDASRNSGIDAKDKPTDCDIDKPTKIEVHTQVSEQISDKEEAVYTIKEKSPNDLSKECVVVIQRKIFKNIESKKDPPITNNTVKPTCDSDSDEAPLINLQKQDSTKSKTSSIVYDDNDFINSKTTKPKPKVKDTKSPKSKLKTSKTTKVKSEKPFVEQKPPPQNSFDDEDDDFDHKKTILIRKTYDKISKPIKAKSTGSITQRDIDNLRDRIEAKKKLLLAQSLTLDTEELRSLIKKWQKGCQDALMELLDLMRNKCADSQRMDYSEMLKALKIPPSLVGYDSENDCFNSPDDASIILGQFKDL